MQNASQPTSSSPALNHFVLRHRRAMVRTFSGVMLAVIAFTFVGPKKYMSEAKQDEMVEGYEEMRSFFGEMNFRRVEWK